MRAVNLLRKLSYVSDERFALVEVIPEKKVEDLPIRRILNSQGNRINASSIVPWLPRSPSYARLRARREASDFTSTPCSKHFSFLPHLKKKKNLTTYFFWPAACQQVKFGVQAVFGPSDPILGQHIHSICDALDIPHLEARLDLEAEAKEFSINLHPAQTLLNAAYQDVMAFLNWTKVAIIYEDDYGTWQYCPPPPFLSRETRLELILELVPFLPQSNFRVLDFGTFEWLRAKRRR